MGDIVDFRKVKAFTLKRTQDRNKMLCTHKHVVIDEENRVVECGKCGIVLDPFEYLVGVCHAEENAFSQLDLLYSEIKKLKKQYNRLKSSIDKIKK